MLIDVASEQRANEDTHRASGGQDGDSARELVFREEIRQHRWAGAMPQDSPAPTPNRVTASCHALAARPLKHVITLQMAKPAVRMKRRSKRSAKRAIGKPRNE